MEKYLEEFLRAKLSPYKTALEAVPLEYRVSIAEDIRRVFVESIDAAVYKRESTFPDTLDGRLRFIYALTVQLGYDFGRLLVEKSGPHLRMGEDSVTVYSEVMALFGKDKERFRATLFEGLKYYILRDRLLRNVGIKPKHILAWLN